MPKLLATAFLALLVGCGGRTAEGPAPDMPIEVVEEQAAPQAIEPSVLVSIVPVATAVEVPRDCTRPVEESCNALDDDCDGVIDDGCEYGSGLIQVTASWDTGADIDLYITGPLGDTLSFQRPSLPTGGRLDHAGRGDCAASLPNPQIENARWVGSRPTEGVYEIEVHYWGECIGSGGPTTVTISVAVARQIAGQYRHSLLPGERVRVVRFVLQ